jgi:hypothetical protein
VGGRKGLKRKIVAWDYFAGRRGKAIKSDGARKPRVVDKRRIQLSTLW